MVRCTDLTLAHRTGTPGPASLAMSVACTNRVPPPSVRTAKQPPWSTAQPLALISRMGFRQLACRRGAESGGRERDTGSGVGVEGGARGRAPADGLQEGGGARRRPSSGRAEEGHGGERVRAPACLLGGWDTWLASDGAQGEGCGRAGGRKAGYREGEPVLGLQCWASSSGSVWMAVDGVDISDGGTSRLACT